MGKVLPLSVQDDLKKAGILLTKEQKLRLRALNLSLKNRRRLIERQINSVVAKARSEGRDPSKGQLTIQERRFIARQMEERAVISKKIFRFGGEKRTPDFDPY